jgi:hypothetical protein
MNTLVRYLSGFALMTALMLARTLARMTVRIIRSAWYAMRSRPEGRPTRPARLGSSRSIYACHGARLGAYAAMLTARRPC